MSVPSVQRWSVLFMLMDAGRSWDICERWWISSGHPPLGLGAPSIPILLGLDQPGA
jgi:hypothetical protein